MEDESTKVVSLAAARRARARRYVLAHLKPEVDPRTLVWMGESLGVDGNGSTPCLVLEAPMAQVRADGWALTSQQARIIAACLLAGATRLESQGR
jgi:hypothetical protein